MRAYKQSRDIKHIQTNCLFCNKSFIGFEGRKYCSAECGHNQHNYTKAAGFKIKVCKCCNKPFIPLSQTGHNTTCSIECNKSLDAHRVILKNRAWRTKEHEVINKIEVFTAHRWHCVMCGIPTPKYLMGSYKPNEPTLDHIIPLSKGGLHIRSNVQLLCRKCNCHIKNNK